MTPINHNPAVPESPFEAFRRVVYTAGAESLANRLGMNRGTLYNKADADVESHHQPTMRDVIAVTRETGDMRILESLDRMFGRAGYEMTPGPVIKVDQSGSKIFLPFELQKSLKKVSFQNQPLAKQNKTIIEFKNEVPMSWWNNPFTYFILLSFIVFINKKSIDLFYLSIMAILGIFFAFVGFYSLHPELGYNYNILLFNPSLLGLLYFYWTKNKKGIYNLALFNILSLVVYFFFIINKAHLVLVLPLVVCSGVVLVRMAIQNKKRIPIII